MIKGNRTSVIDGMIRDVSSKAGIKTHEIPLTDAGVPDNSVHWRFGPPGRPYEELPRGGGRRLKRVHYQKKFVHSLPYGGGGGEYLRGTESPATPSQI